MILHQRRAAVERLALRGDADVLEVGCGTGLNFRYLMEWLDPIRGRLTGLDFSADMLRVAERRCRGAGWNNVSLVEGDATRMSLGRQFDAVLFGYSLTMIPDWRAALRSAADHVRPGGRLAVLDFGGFEGWGPLGPVMRAWLRANHVETVQPYADALRELLPETTVYPWLGGYCFTALARKGT
ncbi:MAG: methyltransferase domain-containing protein [Phycisphaerales bacterium]|nr:methyltransferase domain-containing protein [Phycisphaerales bacterium]